MSSHRLRSQFEALFERYQGKDSEIQLEDVTELLFCTRRNARIVLNKMEEEGWIEWHPAAGRGKLSKLLFKQSRNDISESLARRYLEDGKFGKALTVLDNDASKLTQVIQHYLGVQNQEGIQVVRLPYYRPLTKLNPRTNIRRSEQHIVKQVFSGLTTLDEHEQVGPDIAHDWQVLTPQHWRFYLRPGVRFHNGEPLTIDVILASIKAVSKFPLLDHISDVVAVSDWVIDIHLDRPDFYLDLWLAESCAKITLPEEWLNESSELLPIGTGPYKVVQNDEKRLVLTAFDGYFGFRPLLDQVEVCVIDELHSTLVFPSLTNPSQTERGSIKEDVGLDPGCLHLLLDRRHGLAKSDAWAQYFAQRLNALDIFRTSSNESVVDLGIVPALGLKPGWYHTQSNVTLSPPPEANKTVRIAYQARHPMFPQLVVQLERILKTDNLVVELLAYDEEPETLGNIDIWVKAMGISNYRDDALAGWILNYSDISQVSKTEHFQLWTDMVDAWRREPDSKFPAMELGKSLVSNYQIIPLFHVWMGINHDQCGALQNAKCNALGWFDFSKVWVKPDLG
ncbi:SgrR family transcriptional regulator [Vibrio viridaestus]|uniref:SgrR family transcriptional regulator n=1 Tax=Vibrio viridaestus TaxID=2487322 RepID=A0A3N9TJD7_9VIBR|nr:SgrR family transcriptional regulator [Vibrio viridaestus]RQW64478.1 SgrR family transcriptional regulator [Vibrio viridaestus]